MNYFLGIDTSNYTTSIALISQEGMVIQEKMVLPVSKGAIGLRQSDAVFHHTAQLPQIIDKLFNKYKYNIIAVGASNKPRAIEGSYMPCFTVGSGIASIISSINKIPIYTFSHQQGHIAAGLYSANKLKLIKTSFLAFHVSGGTTECLIVSNQNNLLNCNLVAKTLDLNAGQLIDRVGVMLGLDFPCGKQLEQLALQCEDSVIVKPTVKGFDCCLSGTENICKKMYINNEPKEKIAKYCILYIQETLALMCSKLIKEYGNLPILFVGGVMSNSIIKNEFKNKFNGIFATPDFSADNAAGIAVLTQLIYNKQDDING